MVVADVGREEEKPYVPSIAIEIQSPENTLQKMREKADYYLGNGTRMVVLVYPQKQIVEVRTPDEHLLLTIDDTLDGGNVLPGFKLALRDLFPQ